MDEFEAQAPGAFANARCINCAFACATTSSLSVRLPRPPVGRPRPARPSRPRALAGLVPLPTPPTRKKHAKKFPSRGATVWAILYSTRARLTPACLTRWAQVVCQLAHVVRSVCEDSCTRGTIWPPPGTPRLPQPQTLTHSFELVSTTKYGCIIVTRCQDDKRRSVPHSEAHVVVAR
jgi:hypothetical protein